jgi:hypothetical protein
MKIEPIEFPLGIGIADELRIVVNDGVAYYNLLDTSKVTVMNDGTEFKFKILYSDKLKLSNEQKDDNEIKTVITNLLGLTLIN